MLVHGDDVRHLPQGFHTLNVLQSEKELVRAFLLLAEGAHNRGGRIPATTAIIGSALNIKPILEVDAEGKLITIEKKRGPKMGLKALENKYKTQRNDAYGNRVYIVHGDCEEYADEVEKMIKKENPNADITKMMLCPIIGSHTGPGMVAVIFFGEK